MSNGVKCSFEVTGVVPPSAAHPEETVVTLHPVHGAENGFSKGSPNAHLSLTITDPSVSPQFKLGTVHEFTVTPKDDHANGDQVGENLMNKDDGKRSDAPQGVIVKPGAFGGFDVWQGGNLIGNFALESQANDKADETRKAEANVGSQSTSTSSSRRVN
jgi:hypothetical protein